MSRLQEVVVGIVIAVVVVVILLNGQVTLGWIDNPFVVIGLILVLFAAATWGLNRF